jgi:hypothetical protein
MENWLDHYDPQKGQRCQPDKQLPSHRLHKCSGQDAGEIGRQPTNHVPRRKESICPQQAANKKNTIDQVAYITKKAKEGFARGETTIVVSIDLKAAFDVTDRGSYHPRDAAVQSSKQTKWLADISTEWRIKVTYKEATSKARHKEQCSPRLTTTERSKL